MNLIRKYFPNLSREQYARLENLHHLYNFWNTRVNLISRMDIGNLYEHHVLHSMAIGRYFNFIPGTEILDLGTGGGFPGIPLAILFPQVKFLLVDVVEKKVRAVYTIAMDLALRNVEVKQIPGQMVDHPFDFVVSRAVSSAGQLFNWSKPLIRKTSKNELPNGLILLKGGEIQQEIQGIATDAYCFSLSEIFTEPYFREKFILYFPV